MSDELVRAGADRLSDELDYLRSELALVEYGERMYPRDQVAQMQARIAELEPLVGGVLDAAPADEDP